MKHLIVESRFVLLAWAVALSFGLPRAGQTEMVGELRLQAPTECTVLYDSLHPAPFGGFYLDPGDPGAGQPGSISLSVPGGTLTAEWVRGNGAREVDPSSGLPVEPTPINANAFDAFCELTKGFTSLDLTACGLDIWNSQERSVPTDPLAPRIMIALTNVLSGQNNPILGGPTVVEGLTGFTQDTIDALNNLAARPNTAIQRFLSPTFGANTPTPLVPLSMDPNDGPQAAIPPELMEPSVASWARTGLQPYLTDEQEALTGCGPFYGTQCDIQGIGLIGSELSALLQSWPRSEAGSWDTTDASETQPGTVGFAGEPVCARYQGGMTSILPGCRGPDDPGYDPLVDGTITGPNSTGATYPEERRHPFTDQTWSSSMAALSWNYLEGMVALTSANDPGNVLAHEFDLDDPLRLDGCSLANPLPCCNVASTLGLTTRAPEENPSQPPLRRWLWETGAEYLVTEAAGGLEDFLGWALFAYGPEQSRVSGEEVGVPFFLSPPDPPYAIPDSPLIVRQPGVDGILGTDDDNFAGVAYGVVQDLLMVEIDIKPGNHSNPINPRSKGVIPVAILTADDFDASTVDADSVRFGPAEAEKRNKRARLKDSDHDGDLDLVLQFRTQETGIAPGDTEACLIGQTYDGVPIMGCDSVRTVPAK